MFCEVGVNIHTEETVSERSNEMLQKSGNSNPGCWTQHIILFHLYVRLILNLKNVMEGNF